VRFCEGRLLSLLYRERFFFFVLLLQEENAAESENDGRYNDALGHNGRGITHRYLRASGCVFNLDDVFSSIEKAQDSAVPLPCYVEGTR
jgi:hypothetical protein